VKRAHRSLNSSSASLDTSLVTKRLPAQSTGFEPIRPQDLLHLLQVLWRNDGLPAPRLNLWMPSIKAFAKDFPPLPWLDVELTKQVGFEVWNVVVVKEALRA
jgi:hypothetical protein